MASTRAEEECATDGKAPAISPVEQSETPMQLSVSPAPGDEETKTGNAAMWEASSSESWKKEDCVSVSLSKPQPREGRMNGHIAKTATTSANWRDRHDWKGLNREDSHKNSFQSRDDIQRFDRRRPAYAPLPSPQRDEVEKAFLKGTRSAEEAVKADPAATPRCYVKMLISNQLAGMVIGSTGQEVKRLKEVTGAKIVLSPHGTYFPGTSERLVSAEGTERAVFQVIDWIIDRMHELAKSKTAGSGEKKCQLKLPGKTRSVPVEPGTADEDSPRMVTTTPVRTSSSTNAPPSLCFTPLTCKLCVPRAVVGSLIGRKGGYIQSVRVATEANINISPLFVTADEACAERIITIESPRLQSLRTATFTLARKITSHPEKATCKHMCYYRKLSFEPSPLALINESRRERVSCRSAATRLVSAKSESPVGSAETLARVASFSHHNTAYVSHLHESSVGKHGRKELTTSGTTDLFYHHSGPCDDAATERDVSCFSSASTATSVTKFGLPFEPVPCHSSLSKIGGAARTAASMLSSKGVEATTSATESSVEACNSSARPIPVSGSFFIRDAQSDATRVTESAEYAAPPTVADGLCGVVGCREQTNRNPEPHIHQDGTQIQPHIEACDNVVRHRHVMGCIAVANADKKFIPRTDCQCEEGTVATEEGLTCGWSAAKADSSSTCSVQLRENLCRFADRVSVLTQGCQTTIRIGEKNTYSGIYAGGHLVPDKTQYAPYAFSHESLTPICSTAAGSIATLTNILQNMQEDVPDQQPRSGRSAITTKTHHPRFTKIASQEASATTLQLCKNRQIEQRGTSGPEDLGADKPQSSPSFEMKNVTSETELAAAPGDFARMTQSSAATASTVAAILPVTSKEKLVEGLHSSAAEFFPSRYTLRYPVQDTAMSGDLCNTAAALSAQVMGKFSENSTSEQTHPDRMPKRGNLGAAAGATNEDGITVKQLIDKGLTKRRTAQSLFTQTGTHIQPAPAELADNAKASSAVTCVNEEHESSELALVVNLSSQVPQMDNTRETPLSTRRSGAKGKKPPAEDRQGTCKASETSSTIEEQATGAGEMSTAPLVSSSDNRVANLSLLSRLTCSIPRPLDCSFPAFMVLWTTALVTSLLLSFFFTHFGSS